MQSVTQLPRFVTPEQLVEMTGGQINEQTVRKQCRNAVLPAVKLGRRWYIPIDQLDWNFDFQREAVQA